MKITVPNNGREWLHPRKKQPVKIVQTRALGNYESPAAARRKAQRLFGKGFEVIQDEIKKSFAD